MNIPWYNFCLGKNSVLCSNCTGNKGVVVTMTSKMRYKVCIWVHCQQNIVIAFIKDTGVLKGQWLEDVQVWFLQCSQRRTRRKTAGIAVPSRGNCVINSRMSFSSDVKSQILHGCNSNYGLIFMKFDQRSNGVTWPYMNSIEGLINLQLTVPPASAL